MFVPAKGAGLLAVDHKAGHPVAVHVHRLASTGRFRRAELDLPDGGRAVIRHVYRVIIDRTFVFCPVEDILYPFQGYPGSVAKTVTFYSGGIFRIGGQHFGIGKRGMPGLLSMN